MSLVKQLRTDLVAAIGAIAEVQNRGITPEPVWVPPEKDRSDVTSPEILVAPYKRSVEVRDRHHRIHKITLHAAIFDPLEQGSEDDTAESNTLLAEAMIDNLLGVRFATGSKMICVAAEQPVLVHVSHWRQKRLFTSFVEFTFQ